MPNALSKPAVSDRYKWYVLFILTGVYTFNFVDRQILVILQELIKKDLLLSDTQLGLLTGFAFALFYVTLGIPIARYADKSNRKNIVAVSLSVWSAMTAVCGMAQNFVQLALARIGVGIGEAGGSPPAHAIISDYFPAEKRGTALSIYSTGVYLGIFLGFIVGGTLGQKYGWRVALYALGIPGILYALLVYFFVKEPPKGLSDNTVGQKQDNSVWEVAKLLLSKKSFVFLAFATGLHTFGTYGVGNFVPPFLVRVHGLDTMTIGLWLSMTAGFGGVLGTFAGGVLADRWGRKDKRWYLWITILAKFITFIPFLIIVFSPITTLVLLTTFFTSFLNPVFLGPSIAVTHSLVGARQRAFASAVLFFVLNLIGLGFGPLVIGLLSDLLSPYYGAEALRYSFLFTILTSLLSIFLFYKAAQHYRSDLEQVAKDRPFH